MKLSAILTAGIVALAFSGFASTPDLPSCDVWVEACCYTVSNREASYDINRVVVHKTQGATAAGAASWFANCASQGSAHFSFDKANGYCYQSVHEHDVAWATGYSSTNYNSVSIEHSGWVANNDTSTACYNESAVETKSCVTYYGVPANRTYIIGHNQVPGCGTPGGGGTGCHTDPAGYWNWGYYMNQVVPPPANRDYVSDSPAVSAGWSTGTSASDKYGADYKFKSTAPVSDAATWTINVPGGTYAISAWWCAGANRSAAAPYVLPNNATVNVNQQINGGKWNALGTIGLAGGNNVTKLSCWAATGYVVVADAVKYYGP